MTPKTRLSTIMDIVRSAVSHLSLDPVMRALVVESTGHAVYYAEQDAERFQAAKAPQTDVAPMRASRYVVLDSQGSQVPFRLEVEPYNERGSRIVTIHLLRTTAKA